MIIEKEEESELADHIRTVSREAQSLTLIFRNHGQHHRNEPSKSKGCDDSAQSSANS